MRQADPASGATQGGVRMLLRGEGLALLAGATALYWRAGGDWRQFAVLFLVPDASFAAYLFGPRAGALACNTMHATVVPLALAAAGLALGIRPAPAIALIWLAHIGFDRALAYGLKYGRGFGFTHLGPLGRTAREN